MVSAADISAEEGAVVGIAYDGESFPAMLSFYTEASGDQCVAPTTQLLALWPRSTPLSVVSRAGKGRAASQLCVSRLTCCPPLCRLPLAQGCERGLWCAWRRPRVGVRRWRLGGASDLRRGRLEPEATGGLWRSDGRATADVIYPYNRRISLFSALPAAYIYMRCPAFSLDVSVV